MSLKWHSSGCPVLESIEFDGVGYVASFNSTTTLKPITHCDRCAQELAVAAVRGELSDRYHKEDKQMDLAPVAPQYQYLLPSSDIVATIKDAEWVNAFPGLCIRGYCYGHARGDFEDGDLIRTNRIQAGPSKDGLVRTQSGALYRVEFKQPDPRITIVDDALAAAAEDIDTRFPQVPAYNHDQTSLRI